MGKACASLMCSAPDYVALGRAQLRPPAPSASLSTSAKAETHWPSKPALNDGPRGAPITPLRPAPPPPHHAPGVRMAHLLSWPGSLSSRPPGAAAASAFPQGLCALARRYGSTKLGRRKGQCIHASSCLGRRNCWLITNDASSSVCLWSTCTFVRMFRNIERRQA